MDRIALYGRTHSVKPGDILIEQGDTPMPFFVIMTGEVEIVSPFGTHETLITVHGNGQFTGDVNMISGRRSIVRALCHHAVARRVDGNRTTGREADCGRTRRNVDARADEYRRVLRAATAVGDVDQALRSASLEVEPMQFVDEGRAAQVQQPRGLAFVAARLLEAAQNQLAFEL